MSVNRNIVCKNGPWTPPQENKIKPSSRPPLLPLHTFYSWISTLNVHLLKQQFWCNLIIIKDHAYKDPRMYKVNIFLNTKLLIINAKWTQGFKITKKSHIEYEYKNTCIKSFQILKWLIWANPLTPLLSLTPNCLNHGVWMTYLALCDHEDLIWDVIFDYCFIHLYLCHTKPFKYRRKYRDF